MMVKQATILSELQSIVGKEHAREPSAGLAYSVDGISPQAIVEPGTYEEVSHVLRFANSERLAVIPIGAGSQLHFGNIPTRYDIALSLKRLDKVIEHEPADLTVTCQAGISVAGLNARLAGSGQMVPFSTDPHGVGTVGGRLAANSSGLQAMRGRPRDFTIGLRFVTGDGLIAKTGGRVVKNVAGYDLAKLFIGSRGTLAIIVESTFKVAPLPEETMSLRLHFPTVEDLTLFSAEARRRTLALVSAVATGPTAVVDGTGPPASGFLCHIVSSGARAGVSRTISELRTLAPAHHASLLGQEAPPAPDSVEPPPHAPGDGLQCRASVLPSHLPEAVRIFQGEDPGAPLHVDPLGGHVWGAWPASRDHTSLVERLRALVARLGGHLTVTHCHPELKRRTDVFGPPPPSFPLMRAIKREFDPNNILSPGRFVGRL